MSREWDLDALTAVTPRRGREAKGKFYGTVASPLVGAVELVRHQGLRGDAAWCRVSVGPVELLTPPQACQLLALLRVRPRVETTDAC